ncbi:hypothetical protein ABT173_06655 [Streptomyces sp. NPDC001795]|uniref:hypothetical protein n=1 Tax=unclassified Streptomyces TaxID=2593676 RepID=UPI00332FB873
MLRTISLQTVVANARGLRTTLVAVAAAGVLAAAAVPAVATVAGTPATTTVVAGDTPDDHGWD